MHLWHILPDGRPCSRFLQVDVGHLTPEHGEPLHRTIGHRAQLIWDWHRSYHRQSRDGCFRETAN